MTAPHLKPVPETAPPTWAETMPQIIAALEYGTEFGKMHARNQLMKVAAHLDALNEGEG